ncbi:MAG: phage holin [Peptococcaceae bacterium]|nr:phage holin [Peptococcaceae bacterium]
MFPFSDKVYEWLKWIAAIAMPAFITMLAGVFSALALNGFMSSDIGILVITILGAVNAFIGALVGVSSKVYYAQGAVHDSESHDSESHDREKAKG